MIPATKDRVLVALVCGFCYVNFGGGVFHYDDFHSLVENPHVRSLANIPAFFADPTYFSADIEKKMYRPLLLVTYALQYAVHGYEPLGFLLINLLLHVAASLLVGALATAVLGVRQAGLAAALFFAAHPLATEPVNYISSRSESLAACFYLATILCYWRDRHGAALSLFGLGMLVKSVVLTAPIVLWAGDRWLRREHRSWRIYAPFAGMGTAYLILISYNRFLTGSLVAPARDWTTQFLTQLKVPVYYVQLMASPWRLNVEHQFVEVVDWANAAVWAGGLFAASLSAIAWMGRRRMPGFALLWSAVALLPTTLMPLNVLVNERRLYLVVAALALVVGYVHGRINYRWGYVWLACAMSLCLQRNMIWESDLRLWQDAVSKAPNMYRVQANLGKALQLNGRWDEALEAYGRAIELEGRRVDAFNNMATIFHLQGDIDRAIVWYGKALERDSGLEEVHHNLGDAYAQKGWHEQAVASYRRAIDHDDSKGDTWSNYGLSLYKVGDLEGAETAYRRASELLPDQAEPYNNLGNIYADRGDWSGAEVLYRQALACNPEEKAQVLANLGDLYRKQQRFDEGRRALNQAIDLEGEQAEWYFRLGQLERAADRGEAAVVVLAKAIAMDSTHVAARTHRAEMAVATGAYDRAIADFGIAVAVDPANSRAWFGLGKALEDTEEWRGAVQAYRQFLVHWPKDDARARHVRERLRANEER